MNKIGHNYFKQYFQAFNGFILVFVNVNILLMNVIIIYSNTQAFVFVEPYVHKILIVIGSQYPK